MFTSIPSRRSCSWSSRKGFMTNVELALKTATLRRCPGNACLIEAKVSTTEASFVTSHEKPRAWFRQQLSTGAWPSAYRASALINRGSDVLDTGLRAGQHWRRESAELSAIG